MTFEVGQMVIVDPKALKASPGSRGTVCEIDHEPKPLYRVEFPNKMKAWFRPDELHACPDMMKGWGDL